MTSASALNVTDFGLREMAECGRALRRFGKQARDLDAFAMQATDYFFENVTDQLGEPAFTLVRSFFREARVGPAPDVAQLFSELGLNGSTVLNVRESVRAKFKPQNYDVLYVADANDEPIQLDQHGRLMLSGIRSVIGFGCNLPSGDLFTIILFAKLTFVRNTAELFRTVALNMRLAILRFDRKATCSAGEQR